MKLSSLYQSILLTQKIALRNGVYDHYFTKYDSQGQQAGQICLTCKVTNTKKDQIDYTFYVDNLQVSKKQLVSYLRQMGVVN